MANAVTQANSTTATIQAASANDMTLGDMRRKYDNGAGLFDLSFPSDGKISVREVVAAGGFMDLVLDYYQLSDEDSTAVVEMLSADANTRLVTASIRKNTFMLRDLSHSNKKINKKLRDIATYANGLTVELRLLHEMKQPGGGDPDLRLYRRTEGKATYWLVQFETASREEAWDVMSLIEAMRKGRR